MKTGDGIARQSDRIPYLCMKHSHLTELFGQFATAQTERLTMAGEPRQHAADDLLQQLLGRFPLKSDLVTLQQALLDPYFPLGMLERTIFSDVVGMRFFINKRRADLEPLLAAELVEWAAAFVKIRHDIQKYFDPETITCIPIDGLRHRLPSNQWCTLCGVCCQIGGVPPDPPPDIRYPDHWRKFLSGEAVENQQLCPFLFQYLGEPRFFCAIHHVKPVACRQFDREDCQERLDECNLHA
jgi:hypothetical protein